MERRYILRMHERHPFFSDEFVGRLPNNVLNGG